MMCVTLVKGKLSTQCSLETKFNAFSLSNSTRSGVCSSGMFAFPLQDHIWKHERLKTISLTIEATLDCRFCAFHHIFSSFSFVPFTVSDSDYYIPVFGAVAFFLSFYVAAGLIAIGYHVWWGLARICHSVLVDEPRELWRKDKSLDACSFEFFWLENASILCWVITKSIDVKGDSESYRL